ncbi:type II toxin-antitoxin system RelE/ParE family toxin [Streptomyces sp. NBC_00038]|uniref:type II toxin-antitoxin system RelE/ParE family toxin n=1 Tax=Streptomyces sp. NBC_00038 TaxID=2903615 RepID=UPI00225715CB|nr:type II toxin-antitoxin system RelE/ParE family toxin [Streptomyces sp. NBC_00038]MCX5560414.1 type II toxin-antitoxin system RelE/ParE family toxin [Streptomyces sp. NBC_00038]
MIKPYLIELEPEVRLWLETLPPRHYRQAEEKAELLASSPTTLGEPHSRNLGEGVRELRFALDGNAIRVPYWLAPDRRIVLLTVFRKTKMREDAEVKRAKQAKALCETEHDPAHKEFTRDFREAL